MAAGGFIAGFVSWPLYGSGKDFGRLTDGDAKTRFRCALSSDCHTQQISDVLGCDAYKMRASVLSLAVIWISALAGKATATQPCL